ncbi:substrate-binding periplasmic protein [Pseudoalteromonas sp. SSDWG2]|uniref:substrate-binding periplasmic protein n=1 Tax=Pseudoalteromonas sp. SSDWG2 TaxID=3139391 RepID=UPI003BAA83E9
MHYLPSRIWLHILVLFFSIALPPSLHAEQRPVVTFNKPMDTPQARFVIDVMTRVYGQIGYDLKLADFTHPQALNAANDGTFDGQLGRIAHIDYQYHNLVRVNYPLFRFQLVMLTRCEDCDINSLSSVAFRNGYPVGEQYLDEHRYSGQRIRIENIPAQLNLLAQQQVDAVIALDFHLKQVTHGINQNRFHKHHLQDYFSYHYVHKRHEDKIPALLRAFEKLEREGVIQELKQQYGL